MVWVGYDTPATLGNNETGAAVAAPIWHDFMAVALKDRPALQFPPPPGVTMAQWDTRLGHGDRRVQAGPGARRLRRRSRRHRASATAAADPDAGAAAAAAPAAGGVDSGLGGLY